MKSESSDSGYVEWFSAVEMHQHFKEWSSELLFIKDEHSFFEDLIRFYTTLLIDTKKFSESQNIVDEISQSSKTNNELLKAIRTHKSQLQIKLDGIDELGKEHAYAIKHVELLSHVSNFRASFQVLKKRLFKFIKSIMRDNKQKRLLDLD